MTTDPPTVASRTQKRDERRNWAILAGAALVIVLFAGLFIRSQNSNTKEDRTNARLAATNRELVQQQAAQAEQVREIQALAQCVATYNAASSQRARVLVQFESKAANAATLLAELGPNDPRRPAAGRLFQAAQAAWSRELRAYPVPVYVCTAANPLPVLKSSPLPSLPKIVSVTPPPVVRTVVVPGPVRTVTVVPGKGGAVTKTATTLKSAVEAVIAAVTSKHHRRTRKAHKP